jgi:hypothetical protein
VGEQTGRGIALGDRLRRQGGGAHRLFAALAGVLGADVADHLDPGRDDVELLADLLADPGQLAAADTDLVRVGQIVLHVDARQVIWQRFASALAVLVCRHANGRFGRAVRVLRHEAFRLVEQPHLWRGVLLAGRAELAPQQPAFFFLELVQLALQVAQLCLEGRIFRPQALLLFG